MGASGGALGLSFLAGILSTLSPCVVPLLPLLVVGATSAHAFGLVALTIGLVVSYVAVGMFVATVGMQVGVDGELFRTIAAALLIIVGLVLVSGKLQERFAMSTASVGNRGHSLIARITPRGTHRAIHPWPAARRGLESVRRTTLGAAVLLASQGKDLGQVAKVMTAFGVGAAVPLLGLGLLSRELFVMWRGRMMRASKMGKRVLGGVAILLGLVMATGFDRPLEAMLIDASPDWLTDLTTKY